MGYRSAAEGERRDELVRRRNTLVLRAKKLPRHPLRKELDELEAELQTAHVAPLDHVEGVLARYASAVEAARAVACQRRSRRRRAAMTVSFPLLLVLALAAVDKGMEAVDKADECDVRGRKRGHPHLAVTLLGHRPIAFGCRAHTESDCARVCREEGRCTVLEGRCVASSPQHCRRSTGCDVAGRCSLFDGVCVAVDDRDCAGSEACKRRGLCAARFGQCSRTTLEGCRQAAGCALEGRCSPNPWQEKCVAVSDEDCRTAEVCRRSGACFANSGRCDKTPPPRGTYCRNLVRCIASGFCSSNDMSLECIEG